MADGSEVLPEVSHALSDINKYVRQQPKNGFLNIHHSVVNTYYAVRLSDSSWWARTMRSLGTAPVIYRESHAEASVRQILSLLEGKSNKELAQALFVSEKTIETHLANIYRKVGVKNRLELFSRLQND